MPDLTLFFDLDPEVGMERIKKNNNREINRLDLEEIKFHHKVREGYSILSKQKEHNVVKVNAEKTIQEVFEETKNIIMTNISN